MQYLLHIFLNFFYFYQQFLNTYRRYCDFIIIFMQKAAVSPYVLVPIYSARTVKVASSASVRTER